jgi:predicted nucleic acid-binding protein
MSEPIYCDTNFYLDYFLDRTDGLRPLGTFAFNLIKEVVDCKYEIIISDWVLIELENNGVPEENIGFILNDLKKIRKLKIVVREENDIRDAKKLSKNWPDALHVLLAKRAGAKVLVTRNIKDYADFQHLLEIKLPENL